MEKVNLWKDGEYDYSLAFGFVPNMVPYLHEDNKVRPCMVVVPGGGYCVVSPTEGEIVAKKFYDYGYNAFVVTYTTNILMKEPLKDQPMKDLSRAIRYIRKNAKEYCIDENKIVICGFSAGAHLCGSICVHYNDVKDENDELKDISNRPDAAILSYPVITSGEYAHRESFIALLGADASKEELTYYSLEKNVTENTPPVFLWQTVTDELVPVENSYLFAKALKEKGVKHAHHVFSSGKHGLSLSNEQWKNCEFGEPYTMEQIFEIVKAVKAGTVDIPEENKKGLIDAYDDFKADSGEPVKEAEIWPELAKQWLEDIL
ncbi:MAG: alpha/beta hydrolase [Butyrivibrio sp.]|nr:alpha/beta hydrolase [Butyrivibrio sp.]